MEGPTKLVGCDDAVVVCCVWGDSDCTGDEIDVAWYCPFGKAGCKDGDSDGSELRCDAVFFFVVTFAADVGGPTAAT